METGALAQNFPDTGPYGEPMPSTPIRVVPLHTPELAARPHPAARLTYRNGPLLTAVEVFTVFWGTAWSGQPDLVQKLNVFFDYVLTSSLMDQLAEYSVPGKKIGHGRHIGSATVASPDPGPSVTDAAIQSFLADELSTNHAFPAAGPNSLFFVYLPPGTTVDLSGARSCQQFCGYHEATPGGLYYAVMPAADCSGCLGGQVAFDALTSTSSHELCEAVTDPVPGQGWYDDAHGEIGDICAWKTKRLGAYTVQLEWSNKAGKCV